MSLEAIKQVSDAQAKAESELSALSAEGRKIVSDAAAAGHEKLETVRRECAANAASLMDAARKDADRKTGEVLAAADKECAALSAAAEKRLPDAVRIIVGRVVNA